MDTLIRSIEAYGDPASETGGDFKTEEDARQVFTEAINATECFNVYEEIECWYFGGSVFGDKPTGRIDYVLTPRKILIEAGWKMGIIGVEVKKSGHKAGPLICQMIDYSKAVFRLPETCGASLVCLSAVCCFPHLEPKGRAIGSIMANHRLGHVMIHSRRTSLLIGDLNIFNGQSPGSFVVKHASCGYKNGSR